MGTRPPAEPIKYGKFIRECRVAMGISRTELGRRCGYARNPYIRVYNWENDIRPVPVRLLLPLCEILQIPVTALLRPHKRVSLEDRLRGHL